MTTSPNFRDKLLCNLSLEFSDIMWYNHVKGGEEPHKKTRRFCRWKVVIGVFRLKIDVIAALEKAGYSPYIVKKNRIFGQSVWYKLRDGGLPSWKELDILCRLLGLEITDIIERVPDSEIPAPAPTPAPAAPHFTADEWRSITMAWFIATTAHGYNPPTTLDSINEKLAKFTEAAPAARE